MHLSLVRAWGARLAALALLAACHRTPPSVQSGGAATLDLPAPDSFVVRFATTRGDIDVMVHRD